MRQSARKSRSTLPESETGPNATIATTIVVAIVAQLPLLPARGMTRRRVSAVT